MYIQESADIHEIYMRYTSICWQLFMNIHCIYSTYTKIPGGSSCARGQGPIPPDPPAMTSPGCVIIVLHKIEVRDMPSCCVARTLYARVDCTCARCARVPAGKGWSTGGTAALPRQRKGLMLCGLQAINFHVFSRVCCLCNLVAFRFSRRNATRLYGHNLTSRDMG